MRHKASQVFRAAAACLALILIFACGGCKKAPKVSIANNYGVPFQLDSSRVGTSTGSPGEDMMESLFTGVEFQSYNDSLDMMMALADGKLDIAVTSRIEVNTFNRVNSIYAYSTGVEPLNYRFAVKKGNQALRYAINGALDALRSSGAMEEIISHWQRPEGADYIFADTNELGMDAPALKIAVSGMLEPFFFTDGGAQKGLNVELGKRVAYELGMRAEFYEVPASTLIASLESGKCDAAMTDMLYTKEHSGAVELTNAYYSDELVFVWMAADVTDVALPEFSTLEQLEGRRIAVMTSSVFDSEVTGMVDGAELVYCSDVTAQLQMLSSGRADALALDEPVAHFVSATMQDVCVMPQMLSQSSYGYMLRHRSPLTKKLDAALDGLWADGTVSALWQKWTGENAAAATVKEVPLTGDNGVIRFAFDNNLAPMCFLKDGVPSGFEVELMAHIAQKLNMTIEYTATNFSLLEHKLTENTADVAAGCLTILPERTEKYDMTQATAFGGTVLVVNNYVHVESPSFFETAVTSFYNTFIAEARYKLILRGLIMTVLLSLASTVLGTAAGFGVCLMLRSEVRWRSRFANGYVQLLESTPLLVLLMILYYVVFKNSDIAAIVIAILAFSLNFSAYTAELMDEGIASVSAGQREAALSLGFNRRQTFLKVVCPQAIRYALDDYKHQFISLVEMTSVVGYVAIHDLTKVTDMIRSRTFEAFLPLISTAVIYFIIARALTKLLRFVEIHIDPDHRPIEKALKGIDLKNNV